MAAKNGENLRIAPIPCDPSWEQEESAGYCKIETILVGFDHSRLYSSIFCLWREQRGPIR